MCNVDVVVKFLMPHFHQFHLHKLTSWTDCRITRGPKIKHSLRQVLNYVKRRRHASEKCTAGTVFFAWPKLKLFYTDGSVRTFLTVT